MTLRLRNTLTRQTEPVDPIEPGRVRMYSCGPTVYSYAHVGNLRSYLLADLIRRALLYHGIDVFHVQNITDVGHLRDERFDRGEDRMLVAAGLQSKTPAEIAAAYEAAFHADAALVNILPAHVFPRATDHIAEMIDAGRAARGRRARLPVRAKATSTSRSPPIPATGSCPGNNLDELRAGNRNQVEPDKRDPADFALWKRAGEGRLLSWPTERWGAGLPRLAPRVLGDGDALPGPAVRHPHRWRGQRLPPPRGRDRPVGLAQRPGPGPPLGPRGASPPGRPEDGQVGRELSSGSRTSSTMASIHSPSVTSRSRTATGTSSRIRGRA